MLDRDGVVAVNERIDFERPDPLELIAGAAEAIGRRVRTGLGDKTLAFRTDDPRAPAGVLAAVS